MNKAYHSIRFLLQPEEWKEHAACRGVGPDLFFPTKGRHGGEAKERYCDKCPVRRECGDYAIRTRTEHGVWAGEIRDGRGQPNWNSEA